MRNAQDNHLIDVCRSRKSLYVPLFKMRCFQAILVNSQILKALLFASFSRTRRFLLIEFRDYPSSFSHSIAVSAFIQDAWLHCHTCRHGSTRAGFLLCKRRSLKVIAVSIFISEQGAVCFFQSVQIRGGGVYLLAAPLSRCSTARSPNSRCPHGAYSARARETAG